MFDTIIIPLDMSGHAEEAIPAAIEEVRRHRGRMVLLHVIPRPEPPLAPPHVRRCGPALRSVAWSDRNVSEVLAVAHAYLELVKRRFGLTADTVTRVAVGEPVKRGQAEVDAWPRSLLLMTTGDAADHERTPLSEAARQLLVNGRVPVLGIRHGALPAPRLVLAEDGAPPAAVHS